MKNINAEAFESFLVKTLKLTTEEVASLYNEAGELTDFSLIERKDADRIAKHASDKTNQYSRGLKEGALKLEKAIKEKYEIDSDLTGVELFDSIIETKVTDIQKADPTEVLKHPEVIKALSEKDKALKAKDKEKEEAVLAIRKEIENENLFKQVESSALVEFETLNPILPADPKKAKALKDILVAELKKNKYQKDGENFIILKDDGNPLQNEHGYNVTFQDHIKGVAERYFDFKVAEDRSSSGNQNQSGTAPSGKVRMPKDRDDFVKMIGDQTLTAEERVKIGELWKTKKQ